MLSGFLNIDKPAGITSHDVIYKIRQATKIKRMGHTGTLDPGTTGVLPVAIGSACRLIDYLEKEKQYLAEIQLGLRTDTDDISGRILEEKHLDSAIDRAFLESTLLQFTGIIEQLPPIYSAVHHEGRRLHHLARSPKHVSASVSDLDKVLDKVKLRKVEVKAIELVAINLPFITLRIICSSGTYIRSIARDLGSLLGCGGCLKSLRREKSGDFQLNGAVELNEVIERIKQGKLTQLMIPAKKVLNFPAVALDVEATEHILNGRYVDLNVLLSAKNSELGKEFLRRQEKIVLLFSDGDKAEYVLGLGRVIDGYSLKPEVMLFRAADFSGGKFSQ